MSTAVFPFRGSAVFMKSLQIPGDFLSTWMPVFTDASRLDFRQGNSVPSFQAGARLRQPPAAFLLRETYSRVEYGRAEIQVRSLRDDGYVVLRRIRANARPKFGTSRRPGSIAQAGPGRRNPEKSDTIK